MRLVTWRCVSAWPAPALSTARCCAAMRDCCAGSRADRDRVGALRLVPCGRGIAACSAPAIAGKSAVLPLVADQWRHCLALTGAGRRSGGRHRLIGRWTCADAFGGLLWFPQAGRPLASGRHDHRHRRRLAGAFPRAPDARSGWRANLGARGFRHVVPLHRPHHRTPTGVLAETVEVLNTECRPSRRRPSVRGIGCCR